MFPYRWLIAILALVVIGGLMVSLRQQRLRVMHESIQLHREAGKHRQEIWGLQVQLSEKVTTPQLRDAVLDAGLELAPLPSTPAQNEQQNDEASDTATSSESDVSHQTVARRDP